MAISYSVNQQANANSNSNYQGIIDAFNTLRASQGEEQRSYPPNYQGIIRAILDLQKWGQAGSGPYPPGWEIITDEDGNAIGGNWNPPPANGTLWFDTRQGRLFVWEGDGFYQCNGADGLPHVGNTPPDQQIPGLLWFNTSNQSLYLFDGQSWIVVSASTINTATLALAEPTKDEYENDRPIIPPTDNLSFQSDLNKWTYAAITALEDEVNNIEPVVPLYMSATQPDNPVEGDFWFNTETIQLLVSFDGQWVPTALPLSAEEDYVVLSNNVASMNARSITDRTQLQNQINTLKLRPVYTYDLLSSGNSAVVQPATTGIYLKRNDAVTANVQFTGSNGLSIVGTTTGLVFDTAALQNEINAIKSTYAQKTEVSDLASADSTLADQVAALQAIQHPTLDQVESISQSIASLPAKSAVDQKLDADGGQLAGDLDINQHRVVNVPSPQTPTDVANRAYVDNLRTYADTTYVSKTNAAFNNLKVRNTDISKAGIDFSNETINGQNALKFATLGSTDTVSFGTTDNNYEYAWQFSGNEEFSYIHNSNKVAAISKDGVYSKNLYIADIHATNSQGTVVTNKIDVGETLGKYRAALVGIRVALSDSSSFDEFKTTVLSALLGI